MTKIASNQWFKDTFGVTCNQRGLTNCPPYSDVRSTGTNTGYWTLAQETIEFTDTQLIPISMVKFDVATITVADVDGFEITVGFYKSETKSYNNSLVSDAEFIGTYNFTETILLGKYKYLVMEWMNSNEDSSFQGEFIVNGTRYSSLVPPMESDYVYLELEPISYEITGYNP